MQSVINNSVCLPAGILEGTFSVYLSKCSHSSLPLECHMSLVNGCEMLLETVDHAMDLTLGIHFIDVSLTAI